MKRILFIAIIILSCAIAFGQLTVTVPTVTATVGQTVLIPVSLSGASSTGIPISSANIQITYDTAVLTYNNLVNFYSGTPQSQWFFSGANGIVAANWLEPNLLTLAIPDGTPLYYIQFTYKGGNSPLVFIIYEFTDALYNLVPTTAVNGAVNALPVFRQVTFLVDMTNETVSPSGVHLSGSFNNWNFSTTPMNITNNNIYSATVTLQETVNYRYQFVNGTDTLGVETVPAACGVSNGTGGFLRSLAVPPTDTTLNLTCFSECDSCGTGNYRQVTFRVDMSIAGPSPEGVYLSGTFNNWSQTANPMIAGPDSVYSATLVLKEDLKYQYLFANGTGGTGYETVPSFCGVPNGSGAFNREIRVPFTDTTLTSVCFSECDTCVHPMPSMVFVTFQVDMVYQIPSPEGVHLAGSFQGWDPAATELNQGSDDLYYITLQLPMDSTYEYRFINGNVMDSAEVVPAGCAVNGNRYLEVQAADTVIDVVCYGRCIPCSVGLDDLKETSGPLLDQNYPNPLTEATDIRFTLREPGTVKLIVTKLNGSISRVILDGHYAPGSYLQTFRKGDLAAGLYFYQLVFEGESGTWVKTRKMVIR